MKTRLNFSKKHRFYLVIILLIFMALCVTSLFFPLPESLNYDEGYHYESGVEILRGTAAKRGNEDIYHRNIMPASALHPLVDQTIQNIFPISKYLNLENKFFGRFATIIISVILAIYVFIWSKQLYGVLAGFLALILYVLDPNIIGNSRIITQDLFGATSIFIAIYYFWSFLRFGSRKNLVLSILTFGIAQICRLTAVYLVPIYIILGLGFYHREIIQSIQTKHIRVIQRVIKRSIFYILALILSTILIINIGYSFERSGTQLQNYQFLSHSFKQLQTYPVLKSLSIPIPAAYLQALDFGKYKQETGFGSGMPYLLGQLGFIVDPVQGFKIKGFPQYFLITFLYKVPIATQIFIWLGFISLFLWRKQLNFWQNEAFLIIPSLLYFILMSSNTAQIGIRYILMIFPFLFVFASRIVTGWPAYKRPYRILIIVLTLYLLISNLSYFPHYISYFNELVIDRKMSYQVLVDSNLDWGQNKNYLQDYLQKHPNALFIRYDGDNKLNLVIENQKVAPSQVSLDNPINLLVIEANQLIGITTDSNHFYWLRSSRQPIDHLAYSYLIFKISSQDAANIFGKN